jgi:hypothetical protein
LSIVLVDGLIDIGLGISCKDFRPIARELIFHAILTDSAERDALGIVLIP